MKFGLQTIIWGPAPPDLRGIFRFASQLGFQGIEIFQHPTFLTEQLGSPEALRKLLAEHELILTGLTSGTLTERVAFCEQAGLHPEYLYVDDWDDSIPGVIASGYTVAVHPHVYKLRSLEQFFQELLPRDERLRVLLDPAHLVIQAMDPIQRLEQVFDRLAAVHLKDWVPWFGRSFHRYGQGFIELGKGAVPLAALLGRLCEKQFDGWVVLEQNSKTGNPERSVCQSVNWLLDHVQGPLRRTDPETVSGQGAAAKTLATSDDTAAILDTIVQAQETPDIFPDLVVKAIAHWADCRFVTLWAHCPSQHAFTLVASYPVRHPVPRLEAKRCLSGRAIERKQITLLADLKPQSGREFHCQELIEKLGLRTGLCVPILNRHNPNDIGLLLNLFPSGEMPSRVKELLPKVAEYIGLSAERILADRCARATGAIEELFPKSQNREVFLKQCLPIILREVECEAASVFLENSLTKHLEVAETTGILWHVPEAQRHYERGSGRTGRVWSENVEYISLGPPAPKAEHTKSEESCSVRRRSFLFVPIRDETGQAIGVVRCRNKVARPIAAEIRERSREIGLKHEDNEGLSFSQADATVLQAICDAMVPRLLHFEAEERTFQFVQKLTHELKMPLVGVNSQLDFIEDEVRQKRVTFREDWINECRDSVKLMAALVTHAEQFVRRRSRSIPAEPFRTVLLLRDVIAPVVDQMVSFLKRHQLPRRGIEVGNFLWIPKIWVQFQALSQVFFNLLNNAIKYRFKDPEAFHVKIVDERDQAHYLVRVQNWGPGIDEVEREKIFEMGYRGSAATKYDVSGHGYGLPIAREIMRDHGGDLRLTRLASPTEFTLLFPKTLAQRPPK